VNNKDQPTKIQELVHDLRIADAMSPDVVTVNPDIPMRELKGVLRTHRIAGVPVVDGGRLAGMVSKDDLIECLPGGSEERPVKDIMTTGVRTLYADDALVLAVSKFESLGYGRFPVLDRKSGKLVGILTKGDIVKKLLQRLEVDYQEEEIHRHRPGHIFEHVTADEVTLVLTSAVESGDFGRAGHVSSGLRKTLRHLNIHPQVVRRASIASYEAEMNLVIYAEGGRIAVKVRPDRIQIDVTDRGPGIADVEKALEPGFSTAPDWVRELGFGAGMGLANIRKCADRLKVDSVVGKGTHLRIGIDVNPESAENGPRKDQTR
jgi:CBS domain-containing protein/anti-sigma regulatory factor (Ser/Thr protein kinase)